MFYCFSRFFNPSGQKLDLLLQRTLNIMTIQTELALQLTALATTVAKIGGETRSLLERIVELLAAIADAPVSPEVTAAVAALSAQVAVVDSLVADLPTPPAP